MGLVPKTKITELTVEQFSQLIHDIMAEHTERSSGSDSDSGVC